MCVCVCVCVCVWVCENKSIKLQIDNIVQLFINTCFLNIF